MPAKSEWSKKLSFFKLLLEIPPKATTFFLVKFDSILNLLIPRKFLFFLNKDDKKIFLTACFSLILISLTLCADPTKSKFFFKE